MKDWMENDMIKKISKAKKDSKPLAGIVKSTDNGSIFNTDTDKKIQYKSIHHFDNMEECVCECHPTKKDCLQCYDHPTHLEIKKTVVEYDEEKIMQLIEQDKAKKSKKSWKFW